MYKRLFFCMAIHETDSVDKTMTFTVNIRIIIKRCMHWNSQDHWMAKCPQVTSRKKSQIQWSEHVNKIVRRASRQIGMIYRTFHQHSSQSTVLKLYLAHVRLLLEYASQVWDPYHKVQIDSLERVLKFGLRMSYKQWKWDYKSLLAGTDFLKYIH